MSLFHFSPFSPPVDFVAPIIRHLPSSPLRKNFGDEGTPTSLFRLLPLFNVIRS